MTSVKGSVPSQEGAFSFSASEAFAAFVLACASFAVFRIYAIAFSFGSSFDDAWNLAGLARITDWDSAAAFVFGGIAGPTGRPLALLTFLPQWRSWPSAPEDFLYQNALIHLLNIQLVAWIAYKIAAHIPWNLRSPHWFAVSVALTWGCSPLLFSTTTMIIQRMTSLSALFSFLGILGYLYGRAKIQRNPRAATLVMAVSVAFGTLLATLCKENGALLPGYVILLEKYVLSPSTRSELESDGERRTRKFLNLFCLAPCVLVVGYLVIGNVLNSDAVFRSREFSLEQRLLTESRIVLQYLRLIFLPVRSELTPFYDDFRLSNSLFEWETFFAVVICSSCLLLAWYLRSSKFRLLSFALFWFFWGHITESTVVPLELYFEHRNYLPALAPLLTAVAMLFHPAVGVRLRVAMLGLMMATSTFVLRETAMLWSDSRVAAQSWYAQHPNSLRSLQFYLISLSNQRRYDEYIDVIDSVSPPLSEGSEYALMRVVAYCGLKDPADVRRAASIAKERLEIVPFRSSVTDLLDKLADGVPAGECPGMTTEDVKDLLRSALKNPSPKIRNDIRAQAHEILARLVLPSRDINETMYHLEEAYRLRPTTSVGIAMVRILTSARLYDAAENKLEEMRSLEPRRPFVQRQWRKSLAEMKNIIAEARRDRLQHI